MQPDPLSTAALDVRHELEAYAGGGLRRALWGYVWAREGMSE